MNKCPSCGSEHEPEVVQQVVVDADGHSKVETVVLKFCESCRKSFAAALKKAA